MDASPRVVATHRLPWQFKVGQRQRVQHAPAAPAYVTLPSRNEYGRHSRQQSIDVAALAPRPCAGAELRAPTLEPLIRSSPGSSPLSEGEHQAVSFVPSYNTRALGAEARWVAAQRKRAPAEADLCDGDPQESTGGCRVRPRLERRSNTPTGPAGPSASSANRSCSPSRLVTTAAGIIPHGVSSSNRSSNFLATPLAARLAPLAPHGASNTRTDWPLYPSANQIDSRLFNTSAETGVTQGTTLVSSSDGFHAPAASVTPWVTQPTSSLCSVPGHHSSARPDGSITTVLHATNPRSGPVSGGIEIWLIVDDLPTTSTLYARFGTQVAVTVSPIFHPSSLF